IVQVKNLVFYARTFGKRSKLRSADALVGMFLKESTTDQLLSLHSKIQNQQSSIGNPCFKMHE
ncbi:MAG: hypothetical protein ACK46A_11495, partial [Akkermansiaceae bacterium]